MITYIPPILALCASLLVAGIPVYIQSRILRMDGSVDIRKVRFSKAAWQLAVGLMGGGAVGLVLVSIAMGLKWIS